MVRGRPGPAREGEVRARRRWLERAALRGRAGPGGPADPPLQGTISLYRLHYGDEEERMSAAHDGRQWPDEVSVDNARTTLLQLLARTGVPSGDARQLIGLVEAGVLALAHAELGAPGRSAPGDKGEEYRSGWLDGAEALLEELGAVAERTLAGVTGPEGDQGGPGGHPRARRMEVERAKVALTPLYLSFTAASELDPDVTEEVLVTRPRDDEPPAAGLLRGTADRVRHAPPQPAGAAVRGVRTGQRHHDAQPLPTPPLRDEHRRTGAAPRPPGAAGGMGRRGAAARVARRTDDRLECWALTARRRGGPEGRAAYRAASASDFDRPSVSHWCATVMFSPRPPVTVSTRAQ